MSFQPDSTSGAIFSKIWTERVLIITADHEVKGYVFMPKTGKKSRMLTDVLNSERRFIAIKEAFITYKKENRTEEADFIQLNLNEIILLKPCEE